MNNHFHLLDLIWKRAGRALVVNFNYDTLFEKNIRYINYAHEVDSYIKGPIKVIKIHGAHSWVYSPEVSLKKGNALIYYVARGKDIHHGSKTMEIHPKIIKNMFDHPKKFNLSAYATPYDGDFPGPQFSYHLPAIGIPVASKGDKVCPVKHEKVLKEGLSKIDRILVIGWRAQDEYLINMLKEHLKNTVGMTIVSHSERKGRETAERFKTIPKLPHGNIQISKYEGYTDFMVHQGYADFFQ